MSSPVSNRLENPIPCVWKEAQNNGKILCTPDNHTFTIGTGSEKKLFLRCKFKKKTNCTAGVTVDIEAHMVIKKNGGEHNHDTDLVAKRTQEIVTKHIKNSAHSPSIPPRIIIQNIFQEMDHDPVTHKYGPQNMIQEKSFARMLQLERKKNLNGKT